MLIVPIVEGAGDTVAFPRLLQRLLYEKLERFDCLVATGKGSVVTAKDSGQIKAYLGKYLLHAQRKPGCEGILVLIDTDGDNCPVDLAYNLHRQVASSGVGKPVEIVCANQEYESWFLASLATIRGNLQINARASLEIPAEMQSDPKGWLSRQMPKGRSYKPTSHQLALSEAVDLELAYANSRSFRRLCNALETLVA